MRIERVTSESVFNVTALQSLLAQQSPTSDERKVLFEDFCEAICNPNFYLFIATDHKLNGDEKWVGMATIFFQRNIVRWIAEIHDVVVDENYRGHGIGKALVRKTLDTAQSFSSERGAKLKLYLTSRPSRVAANALYASLGFILVAEASGSWGTNLYKLLIKP